MRFASAIPRRAAVFRARRSEPPRNHSQQGYHPEEDSCCAIPIHSQSCEPEHVEPRGYARENHGHTPGTPSARE